MTSELGNAAEPWADIDLDALRHNLARVQTLAPESQVMAVIKANAYGHGAVATAKALLASSHPPAALAVARFSEAKQLRDAGISAALVVLEGVSNQADTDQALALGCSLTLHQPQQLQWLFESEQAPAALPPALPQAWLKLETGMHRLGLAAAVWLNELRLRPDLHKHQLGLLTHLACADNTDRQTNPHTQQQLQRFHAANPLLAETLGYQPKTSIANSAGICGWPNSHDDWVRPGIMLYGSSPLRDKTAVELGLQPVMTLQAPILDIQTVQAGETVGYGNAWRATETCQVATIAIGYGDGYSRQLAGRGMVLINDRTHPVIGRVSMDKIAIQLQISDVQIGRAATLWGKNLPIDEIATQANTIGYELLSSITSRVRRRYLNG